MLDVHPPEHAPHTIRDFLLHILTITIGLLIALGLEALVEWRHHVHLEHQAERNIRMELEANRKDLASVIASFPEERQHLQEMLTFLRQREQNQTVHVKSLSTGLNMLTPQEASWQTASATNALSYMPYDEVERFAGAYNLQRQLVLLQNGAITPLATLFSTFAAEDPQTLKPADATTALAQVRIVMANLEILRNFSNDLEKSYAEALRE